MKFGQVLQRSWVCLGAYSCASRCSSHPSALTATPPPPQDTRNSRTPWRPSPRSSSSSPSPSPPMPGTQVRGGDRLGAASGPSALRMPSPPAALRRRRRLAPVLDAPPAAPTRERIPPPAVGRALLKKDYAYVCIRPLAFMPGDALDPNFAVHCYLQSGSGTAPTWTIAYDDYGTHNEVDPRHPDRHCVRVKSASLQVGAGARAAARALAACLPASSPLGPRRAHLCSALSHRLKAGHQGLGVRPGPRRALAGGRLRAPGQQLLPLHRPGPGGRRLPGRRVLLPRLLAARVGAPRLSSVQRRRRAGCGERSSAPM